MQKEKKVQFLKDPHNSYRSLVRSFGNNFTKNQRSKTSRNPKTGEKVIVEEKKSINFKMSKDLFNEVNDE